MSSTSLILHKINPTAYENLPILRLVYGTASTKFGKCLLALHDNTLCYLSFYDSEEPPLPDLEKTWQNAILVEDNETIQLKAKKIFEDEDHSNLEIYLKGTDFEIGVWEALLRLKKGTTASYEDVAKGIGRPKALRAVGRAIGKNPVGYIVPCHRVISKDGSVHNYRSGAHRKLSMLKEEGAVWI